MCVLVGYFVFIKFCYFGDVIFGGFKIRGKE